MSLVYLACLALFVAVTTWFLVSRLIGLLNAHGIVDRPNDRTLHLGEVPRGGGLVIVFCLLISIFYAAFSSTRAAFFLSLAALTLGWAALSWVDDKHDLSARKRLVIQVFFCILTVAAFGWVDQVDGFGLGYLGAPVSVVGVLWMANLYNFMDGMDGLAGAQTVVASSTLSFWFYICGDTPLALICLVLAASAYGFVLHNWSPAKIFMGDVGSITIGGFFGTLIIIGSVRHDISVLSFICLFAVFIVDASFTIIRRAVKREKIWQPHRQHFYQRLATAGYSHSYIALAATILMLFSSVMATLSVAYHDMIEVSILGVSASLLIVILLVVWLEKRAQGSN